MDTRKKKILVADNSEKTRHVIESYKGADSYEFMFVQDGISCKQQIANFEPDLILLELFLPRIHGIEILKWIKNDVKFQKIGVIIMTYELMLQNYKAAIEFGSEYFLDKPLKASHLFLLFERYFTGILEIEPFPGEMHNQFASDSYYDPSLYTPISYLKFWGTRGSISVSGEPYVRMGGNTSTLEIRDKKQIVIIDSGTGIRRLGEKLMEEKRQNINILISHTHQDHVVGFPFFTPLYSEKTKLNIWSPIGFEKTTEGLFTQMLAYSFFPIRLDQMRAEVKFLDLHDSEVYDFDSIKIACAYTYHPGATLGFKIYIEDRVIGYITDNEFLVGYHGHPSAVSITDPILDNHLPLIQFLSDCDTIVHEAQYFPKEYEQRVGWGHSSLTNATTLFKFLNCNHWIVTHHDPRHTDRDLDLKYTLHKQLLEECGITCKLTYAYDGMILPIKFKEKL
jgi:ribonuclease BN (tRNA processing enzyme)